MSQTGFTNGVYAEGNWNDGGYGRVGHWRGGGHMPVTLEYQYGRALTPHVLMAALNEDDGTMYYPTQ